MNYEVLRKVKAITPDGMRILEPGQVIELNPDKADKFIEAGTIRPVQQTTKGGLVDLMMTIWLQYFEPIKRIWPRGFISTPEMAEAEVRVEKIHKSVLEGKSTIGTFRQAVQDWYEKALKTIKH